MCYLHRLDHVLSTEPGPVADRPPAKCYISPMARKFVITLVVLAITLLTYAPAGGLIVAMTASDETAMADCAMPAGECCNPGDKRTERTCAIYGGCLANCAVSPSFLIAPSSISFGPSSNSTEVRPDADEPVSALGFPPFRPPRHSSLA